MRSFLINFILVLYASVAFSGQGMYPIPQVYTASSTVLASNIATVTGGVALDPVIAKGQSFTPTQTKLAKKIVMNVYSFSAGATLTCRLDDDSDLSSEYIEQANTSVSSTGTVELTLSGANTVTNGTLYYIGCIRGSAAISLGSDSGASYIDGSTIYSTGGNWIVSGATTSDLVFQVIGE